MIRVAAVGDLHVTPATRGALRRSLADVGDRADVLLLAGDLTDHGRVEEAEVLCAEVSDLGLPTVAVLGNHDHHADRAELIATALRAAGVAVLDGTAVTLDVRGTTVGVGGAKGFGGGFGDAAVHAFGEAEMKRFAEHTARAAQQVRTALAGLDTEVRIALVHYAPTPETLAGEPVELFPWLGSSRLAEAIDAVGRVDVAFHGHAHYGSERGTTPGGVPVRNVARPLVKVPYTVYAVPGAERIS